MDEYTRQVFAEYDRVNRDYADWQARRQQRSEPEEPEPPVTAPAPTHADLRRQLGDVSEVLGDEVWRLFKPLMARVEQLENSRLRAENEMLRQRNEQLEEVGRLRAAMKSPVSRSTVYLDDNLRETDIDNSKFVKVEFDGGIELLKIVRLGTGDDNVVVDLDEARAATRGGRDAA
jgi:hypothetical protein